MLKFKFKRVLTHAVLFLFIFTIVDCLAFARQSNGLQFSQISLEQQDWITKDLTLIKSLNGIAYTWHSSKPSIINDIGVVKRPMPGESDQPVTLTATTSNGGSAVFDVIVKAFENNGKVIEKAKEELDFSVMSQENISSVTRDLHLPAQWSYNTFIYWTSTNENSIAVKGNTGIITRPPFGEGFSTVIVTANIVFGQETGIKHFVIKVKEEDAAHKISAALTGACNIFEQEFLSVQNILALRNDLIIPEIDLENIKITCLSENPDVITSDGKITRLMTSDQQANFIVYFSCGYEKTARGYTLVVKAIEQDVILNKIEQDLDWLAESINSKHNLNRLSENIFIPPQGPNGSKFECVSSDAAVITSNGEITRTEAERDAVLTISAHLNYEALSRTIPITLLPQKTSAKGTGSSGLSETKSGSGEITIKFDNGNSQIIFNDLPPAHWAFDVVLELHKKKIISGIGNNLFAPDELVTREQFVKMVVEAMGYEAGDYEAGFEDVSLGNWYYDYVNTAYFFGLISGISQTEFGVQIAVSRQDMAVIIKNAMMKMDNAPSFGDQDSSFSDMEAVSSYAKESVAYLKKSGIVIGKGENEFQPETTLTRAEAAMIIYRLLNYKYK